jgi:hypothetical protein
MPLTTEWQAHNVRVPDSGRSLAAGGRGLLPLAQLVMMKLNG